MIYHNRENRWKYDYNAEILDGVVTNAKLATKAVTTIKILAIIVVDETELSTTLLTKIITSEAPPFPYVNQLLAPAYTRIQTYSSMVIIVVVVIFVIVLAAFGGGIGGGVRRVTCTIIVIILG